MQIEFESTAAAKIETDALAVICFESPEPVPGRDAVSPSPVHDSALVLQSGWMAELRRSGEFTGKLYETALLHRPEGVAAKRLLVIGGGKQSKFTAVEARRLGGVLARTAKGKGIRAIALSLDSIEPTPIHPDNHSGLTIEAVSEAVAEGAVIGNWEADRYRTDPKKNEKQVDTFRLVWNGEAGRGVQAAIDRGRILAEGQNYARDLVNEPGNKLTPAVLAARARETCEEFGLTCEVLDQAAMEQLGMGALLGVAQGSTNPPFLIAMKYAPATYSGSDHLALVGKGVTFDTGGISIKSADGMEKMKYDMAGAAAVIGAMRAIAQLKPELPVTAYVPTVENMLNGNAQRPGDIVTSLAGKTIEVLNTDAEGRLILADAITYAKRNGATHLVDAATLTGAIGIALGHYNAGAFTNDQPFLNRFLSAANTAGEKFWQLPMDDEYKEYLKSAFADLPNIGGRYGGSITAAWFLREFADPTPWVHLDIAAMAWLDDAKSWIAKGPTGIGVRSFVQLARCWNQP